MELNQARHAFVTGGASGIGLAIADALAAKGVPVNVADNDTEAMAHVIVERSAKFRGQALDVRDCVGWIAARAASEAAFGPVDILVNNAGIGPDGQEFADMDPTSFDRMIAINLVGVFNGVSTFAAALRQQGRGHIINVSSTAGLTFSPQGAGAYTVAKHGVVSMSETLRTELAPYGVGVSVLCPGLVDTNLPRSTARISGDPTGADARMPVGSIDPAIAGKLVARAIERNEPYVLTHPDYWPGAEIRLRAIEAAFHAQSENRTLNYSRALHTPVMAGAKDFDNVGASLLPCSGAT